MNQLGKEWDFDDDCASRSKFKKFHKAHPREFVSLFANLDTIQRYLSLGLKVSTFKLGFFRSEGDSVYRISQTSIPSAHESRLYIYLYFQNRTIYILGIGDKPSQQADIKAAKALIRKLPNSWFNLIGPLSPHRPFSQSVQKMKSNNRSAASLAASLADDPEIEDLVQEEISRNSMVTFLMQCRLVKGITQEQIAKEMSCAASKISRLESNPDDNLKWVDIIGYSSAMNMNVSMPVMLRFIV